MIILERRNAGGRFELIWKKRLNIILIILTLLFFIFALFMAYVYLSYGDDVLSVTKLNATIGVDDYIGFNLDKDMLHFGTAFPGGKSMRELSLGSQREGYVYITVDDFFKDWVRVSVQNERIDSGGTIPVQISVFVPENASLGNYSFGINLYILEKKADIFTKMIIRSSPAVYNAQNLEDIGSGKVTLEIVNSSLIR